MSRLRVLHLTGSAQDRFHRDLSRLYARDCLAATADPTRYEFQIAYITPDRQWRFPLSLSDQDIATAETLDLSEAIALIQSLRIDVVIPQMFCLAGMTLYRNLFDLLGIPYVGNAGEVMALTARKDRAKAIAAGAGVKVPYGELLKTSNSPTLRPPVVIKPSSADNSLGVSLVSDEHQYTAALQTAFSYADTVLVEEYIEPGREVRCGLVEKEGELIGLPLEEYPVDAKNHPIRSYGDKLERSESGDLALTPKGINKSWIVDPSDSITPVVQAAAKQCHQALGCRHYSLFDFRIDPQGNPYFLEAGLYCSFSPRSVIAEMAKSAGLSLNELLAMTLKAALRP
ncbi:D-alanine--D-alanine ligase [Oscillatoria sp. CS-180]|uniref:D-alanine--D-alanine ligase family protein n=1 Tax=Oscillatoria sp. CS-180 TaxID=3021720 RepID=UPI00232FF2E4|nr:D-alanine--D-alanine ligase [Oscillatoria sp. CS-180]MDB9528358.1 D-alanine--D-alanine ligase [Oscillatoria sp. CS-180]